VGRRVRCGASVSCILVTFRSILAASWRQWRSPSRWRNRHQRR
jgi:hypothetical protein